MHKRNIDDEQKHELLKEILKILNLPEFPYYFSSGSTITAEALLAIRDELHRRNSEIKK